MDDGHLLLSRLALRVAEAVDELPPEKKYLRSSQDVVATIVLTLLDTGFKLDDESLEIVVACLHRHGVVRQDGRYIVVTKRALDALREGKLELQ